MKFKFKTGILVELDILGIRGQHYQEFALAYFDGFHWRECWNHMPLYSFIREVT